MKHYFIVLFMALSVSATAQKPRDILATEKLPEGVWIEEGKLKVKAGYVAVLSKDRKSAEIRKLNSKSVEGIFSCGCESATSSCSVITTGSQILCTGTCNCVLVTTINSVKYMVNLQTGGMQRKPGQ